MKRTVEMYKNIMEKQRKIKSFYDDIKSRMEEMIESGEELNDTFLLNQYTVYSVKDLKIIDQTVTLFNQKMLEEEIGVKAYIPVTSIITAEKDIQNEEQSMVDIYIIIR